MYRRLSTLGLRSLTPYASTCDQGCRIRAALLAALVRQGFLTKGLGFGLPYCLH
jgi:hypothetical protein